MIYGLLPVGGEGRRLSLPFPKELLPQKGFNYYNPVINHSVEKMLSAGAKKIVLVHGADYKQGIVNYYTTSKVLNICQAKPGFSEVLRDFYINTNIQEDDQILFGLPDSVYTGNTFIDMVSKPGIVCGIFMTTPDSRVDRMDINNNQYFHIKSNKNSNTQELFWGTLKFDGRDLMQIMAEDLLTSCHEIGDILNLRNKSFVAGGSYLDLGTWENYNKYLSGELL